MKKYLILIFAMLLAFTGCNRYTSQNELPKTSAGGEIRCMASGFSELVNNSDLIVIAEYIDLSKEYSGFNTYSEFEIIQVLEGIIQEKRLVSVGPGGFDKPFFRKDENYLLFLTRNNDKLYNLPCIATSDDYLIKKDATGRDIVNRCWEGTECITETVPCSSKEEIIIINSTELYFDNNGNLVKKANSIERILPYEVEKRNNLPNSTETYTDIEGYFVKKENVVARQCPTEQYTLLNDLIKRINEIN